MNRQISLFSVFLALLAFSGCTSIPPSGETPVNETPPRPVLHHNDITIHLSEIEIKDPELFTTNLTSTITMLLLDARVTLLLEHGWNITSVKEFDEKILDRPYVLVEFMKNDLSFYFVVDEEDERILRGYCSAKRWNTSTGPRPEDYYQVHDKKTGLENVVDVRNESDVATVMIYGDSKILYLNPRF